MIVWNRTPQTVDATLAAHHAVRFARYYRLNGHSGLAAYMLTVAADLRRSIV